MQKIIKAHKISALISAFFKKNYKYYGEELSHKF